MSGIIGHTMYAILGAKASAARRLPVAPVVQRHWASYLAGAYVGCDVQTMPEAICVDTGREVGYGTARLTRSPLTGGEVRPYALRFRDAHYTPYQVHEMFYGRAHLVFGWSKADRDGTIPWDHLVEYGALVAEDALDLFGPGERPLAYTSGWLTHVVGDCLIKSIQPGLDLHLLDGKYTPRNRPIQDLVTYHEIGRKELGLHWPALWADLADTPVEPIQLHYMRVGPARGRLAHEYPEGWRPDRQELLGAVLAENRRYLPVYLARRLEELELVDTPDGAECRATWREATGGLTYARMVELAERCGFRRALWQIGEAIAELFAQVFQVAQVSGRAPSVSRLPVDDGPTWKDLTERWLADGPGD